MVLKPERIVDQIYLKFFLNVMLADRVKNKEILRTVKQEMYIVYTIKRRKINRIGRF